MQGRGSEFRAALLATSGVTLDPRPAPDTQVSEPATSDTNSPAGYRPAPDALDVERLAYALNRAFGLQVVGGPLNEIGANPMAAAERLAREYAALEAES